MKCLLMFRTVMRCLMVVALLAIIIPVVLFAPALCLMIWYDTFTGKLPLGFDQIGSTLVVLVELWLLVEWVTEK